MKRLLEILQFWVKVMFVVFVLTGMIAFVLLLTAGGWSEVSLLERVKYALKSGVANGVFVGTIAALTTALFMVWKTRRVIRQNQKKLALRDQSREKTQS
jgi:hypothetical protein